MTIGIQDARFRELMRAAQDGDRQSYEILLGELTPVIGRMVGRRWAGGVDKDDVVQDVLVSLHAVRHTYDPDRPFLPWLKTIAGNRLVDAQRRAIRRAAHEVVVDTPPETFSHPPTNTAEEAGDPEALHAAIRRLPKGQRNAVEMLKLRELTLKEASAESGMTVAALKVAMHRALKSLRTTLKPSG